VNYGPLKNISNLAENSRKCNPAAKGQLLTLGAEVDHEEIANLLANLGVFPVIIVAGELDTAAEVNRFPF